MKRHLLVLLAVTVTTLALGVAPVIAQSQTQPAATSTQSSIATGFLKFIAVQSNGDMVIDGALAISESVFLVRADALADATEFGVAAPEWTGKQPFVTAEVISGGIANGVAAIRTKEIPMQDITPVMLAQGLSGEPGTLRLIRYEHDITVSPPVIAREVNETEVAIDPASAAGAIFLVSAPTAGIAIGPLVNGCDEIAGFMLDNATATGIGFPVPAGQSAALAAPILQQVIEASGETVAVADQPCTIPFPAPQVRKPTPSQGQGHPTQTPQRAWTTELGETQELLQNLGHYGGPIDDRENPELNRAIRRYEADRGLPNTGRISDTLLDLLRSEVAQSATQTPAVLQQGSVGQLASQAVPQSVPQASAVPEAEILGRLDALESSANEFSAALDTLAEGTVQAGERDEALSEAILAMLAELASQSQTIEDLQSARENLESAVATLADELANATAPGPMERLWTRLDAEPLWAAGIFFLVLAVLVLLFLLLRRIARAYGVSHGTNHVVAPPVPSGDIYRLQAVDGVGTFGEISASRLSGPGGVTLGRGQESGIVINDTSISRRHARLGLADGAVWLEDLDSGNGSLIDGRRLMPNTPTPLAVPGEFQLGQIIIRIDR